LCIKCFVQFLLYKLKYILSNLINKLHQKPLFFIALKALSRSPNMIYINFR